jgi:hypothetical protein
VVSLLDDSLNLFLNLRIFSAISGFVFFITVLSLFLVYVGMGLTPAIPKRYFLPITLFIPLASLTVLPCLIYFYQQMRLVAWIISCTEVIFALGMLRMVLGEFRFRWPLVNENLLGVSRFSWANFAIFLLANSLLVVPALVVYLCACSVLAVNHFSEGFVALHPAGITVQVRKYVRADGKTIQLVPMAHVGEREFYHDIAKSFPTNSLILMEGVSDHHNLLTNKISYNRMATSLHLSEQQKEFKPSQDNRVRADVDVDQFTTNTISFLNFLMLVHSKGLSPENLVKLAEYSQPSNFEDRLFDDLLTKRNQHLLKEIESRLSETDSIIVPWGAAHIPGIAKEVRKLGFHQVEAKDYFVIKFRARGHASEAQQEAGP